MRRAVPLLAVILIIVLVTAGFMISVKLPGVDKTTQKTDSILEAGNSSTSNSKNGPGTENPESLSTPVPLDLNDVAVYNGIISEISVSPTVVTYDYNHDGIVDVKKTVLFFNIG
ncbi:MAG: hypothetical protein ABSE07_09165 [Methanoregula sp.]|jgi:hypothetical protein